MSYCALAREVLPSGRVLVRLLILLVTLAVVPVAGDVMETTVHAIEYGDLAHAPGDEHESAPCGQDEHGCTPTMHLCTCHPSAPVVPTVMAVVATPPTSAPPAQMTWMLLGSDDRGAMAPPTRPPIA